MIDSQQKFVFAGNMGTGKTTAIGAISGSQAMRMEVPLPEEEHLRDKTTTTVGFDFGVLSLQGTPLYLYGTPGQEHFHVVATTIMADAVGVVLLINGEHGVEAQLDAWLALITQAADKVPIVVALNRQTAMSPSLASLRERCRTKTPHVAAVVVADPRRRLDMCACLRVLVLAQVET